MKNAFLKLKDAYKETMKKNRTFKSKIPNILTCSRALAPFIIIPLVLSGNLGLALISGSILAGTDFFDGMLARKLNAQSEFGRIIDPIVDKIFAFTLLSAGAILNPIILINIIPEIAIAITNTKALNEGLEVSSSSIGKFKTWLLSINILLSFIPGIDILPKAFMSFITFGSQSLVYLDYHEKNKKLKREKERKELIELIENVDDDKEIPLTKKEIKEKKKKISKMAKIRKRQMELLEYKKYVITESKKKPKQKSI